MELGFILMAVGLLLAMFLTIVAVGYLAVRGHFHEIPLTRSSAIAMSSFVAAGLAAAWLALSIFGFALGQVLGNANLGSLIGGLLGLTCWIVTTTVYGARITRSLADLRVATGLSPATASAAPGRTWLRIGLGVIFLVVVAFVAGAVWAALNSTGP